MPDKHGYEWGVGRRKTSVARVRIKPGTGIFQVNGKEMKQFFTIERQQVLAISPLVATNTRNKLDVFVNVNGGGPIGQAGAVVMGVARALLKMDGSHDTDAFQAVFEKYQVLGMPTVVFIDASGRELPVRVTGAVDGDEMLKWLGAVDKACASPALACVSRW